MPRIKVEEEDELEVSSDGSYGDEYVDEEYELTDTLEPGLPNRWSCTSLHEDVTAGLIDLDAEYQRGVVWDERKQSAVIDSIFRNYYIPPILFAVVYARNGDETRVCIDGKQRLTAICKFLNGEIPHIDPTTKEKYWVKANKTHGNKKKQRLLPQRLIRMFKSRQMLCMEFKDLTPAQEREIFQRVQKGMPLTVAERQQAIDSPYRPFIGSLQATYVDDPINKHQIDLKLGRTRGYQLIAETVAAILRGVKPVIPVFTNHSLEKWLYENKAPLERDQERDITATYSLFSYIAEHYGRTTYVDPPRIAPIEFMYTVYLIHIHKGTLNEAQLARAICDMRQAVRSEHKDIRLNSSVRKTLTGFVTDQLPLRIQNGDYNLQASSNGTGGKRKASEMENDTESDVEMVDAGPTPKKRIISPPGSKSAVATVAPLRRSGAPSSSGATGRLFGR